MDRGVLTYLTLASDRFFFRSALQEYTDSGKDVRMTLGTLCMFLRRAYAPQLFASGEPEHAQTDLSCFSVC